MEENNGTINTYKTGRIKACKTLNLNSNKYETCVIKCYEDNIIEQDFTDKLKTIDIPKKIQAGCVFYVQCLFDTDVCIDSFQGKRASDPKAAASASH